MPMTDDERLGEVLADLAGIRDDKDLAALIHAIRETAIEEAFDYVTGDAPIPTSMADARALRLRRLCHYAGRPLRVREIEVVFRISAAAARSIDTRMRATYPLEMQSIDGAIAKAMRDGATVSAYMTPAPDSEERYRVHFDAFSSMSYADQMLQRAGLVQGVEHPGDNKITFPVLMTAPDGKDINALTEVLALREPK
jgi:hypothetical protein